eukprot:2551184-Prymnesium_polylepis.2
MRGTKYTVMLPNIIRVRLCVVIVRGATSKNHHIPPYYSSVHTPFFSWMDAKTTHGQASESNHTCPLRPTRANGPGTLRHGAELLQLNSDMHTLPRRN